MSKLTLNITRGWLLEQLHQFVHKCAKWKKVTTFTQFEQKITHISGCKLVYKYTIATVTVYVCMITITCVFIILLISHLHLFFSLFHAQWIQWLSFPHLLFPQMHTNTPTHKNIHTDKSTHKHTHTQTNPHKQTNKKIDWCLIGMIGAWLLVVHVPPWSRFLTYYGSRAIQGL